MNKILYGLRQAQRVSYCKNDIILGHWDFREVAVNLQFIIEEMKLQICYCCVFMWMISYTWSSTRMLEEFRHNMMNKFETTDLGPLQYFLGLEIQQQEGFIHVSKK